MNFKKTLLASLLMISASGAFAADTATLLVKGTIAPTACDVTIGSAGEGTLTFDVTDYDGALKRLEPQSTPFNITCSSNAAVTYSVSDDSFRPNASTNGFGLGWHNGADIGYYTMLLGDVTVDNARARAMYKNNSYSYWVAGGDISKASVNGIHSFAPATGELDPVRARSFSGTMKVSPSIHAGLPVGDEIELNGLATFTVTMI